MPYLRKIDVALNPLVIHVKGAHSIKASFTLDVISHFRLLDYLYIIKQTYGIVRDGRNDRDNRDDLIDISTGCHDCSCHGCSSAML